MGKRLLLRCTSNPHKIRAASCGAGVIVSPGGYGDSPTRTDFEWTDLPALYSHAIPSADASMPRKPIAATLSDKVAAFRDFGQELSEMGIGKGGRIHQKIYPDPYGIE